MDAHTLPIERLIKGEAPQFTRAYSALIRAGIDTIGDLIRRSAEVPRIRGVGVGTWNVLVGCMMDFDTANGTQLEKQFTSAL